MLARARDMSEGVPSNKFSVLFLYMNALHERPLQAQHDEILLSQTNIITEIITRVISETQESIMCIRG